VEPNRDCRWKALSRGGLDWLVTKFQALLKKSVNCVVAGEQAVAFDPISLAGICDGPYIFTVSVRKFIQIVKMKRL
jgi:hypothetical protein